MAKMTDLGKTIYNLTRFQIIQSKLNNNIERTVPDHYAFAWDEEIYPYFDDYDLHVDLKSYFKITEEMVREISEYADNEWRASKFYTFYEYEKHFNIRGNSLFEGITRPVLVSVFRFFFLQGFFDQRFWSKLLEDGQHPGEAARITHKYEPPFIL